MKKYLIVGDTHLDTKYPGYLHSQIDSIKNNIVKQNPSDIIFLGDISDKRKPSPEVLLGIKDLFTFAKECVGHDGKVFVIMGNHDASNKSDDGVTYLKVFQQDEKLEVYNKYGVHYSKYHNRAFHFIPHYEDENVIKQLLPEIPSNDIVFGHFGYVGCINSIGDYDFSIDPSAIHNKCYLGHIHRKSVCKNIEILGTPYPTSFFESEHKGTLGLIKVYNNGRFVFEDVPFVGGPRYINVKLDDIDQLKQIIRTTEYYNVVRVLLSPTDSVFIPDLIKNLIENYGVDYVDVKYVNPDIDLILTQNPYLVSPGEFNEATFDEYLNKLEFPYEKREVIDVLNRVKQNNDSQ